MTGDISATLKEMEKRQKALNFNAWCEALDGTPRSMKLRLNDRLIYRSGQKDGS